jgi:membrane protein implicated in regulation of membrane protease activity
VSDATVWWVLTALLVGAELVTGTFYLLMLALGAAGGALAAYAGLGQSVQLIAAGVLGGALVGLWHWRRSQQPRGPEASADKNVNMDIGSTVQVTQWEDGGKASVNYRGAIWRVVLAAGAAAAPGEHVITQVQGNHLVVKPL